MAKSDLTEKPSKLQRVPTKELKIGMYVHDIGKSWFKHPWASKSKLLTSQKDINKLLEFGISEVVVDLARSATPASVDEEVRISDENDDQNQPDRENDDRSGAQTSEQIDPFTIDEELPKAQKAYTEALQVTREFITDVRAGKKIQVEKVKENVENMIDSVLRNRNALKALLKIKTYDEYTFTHSLNVAVLSISFGRHLEMGKSDLFDLCLGTLFHDIGKTGVPDGIINKPGRLTDEEFNTVKKHPEISARILSEQPTDFSPVVIKIARHHHERSNGSGYPDKLSGDEIHSFATIAGIADVYDALSSDRVYHKGMLPHEALKIVFGLRGEHFTPQWVDLFIQSIGIYPIGSLVELNTGEIAVVYEVNDRALLKPKVRLITDSNKRFRTDERTVDLNEPEMGREIVHVLDPASVHIDPSLYFQGK